MTVVDLYNVELLHNARVQAHFFCLKAREDLLAQVDSNAIVELLLALKVSLVLFKFALNSVDVARVFEKGIHSLFTLLDVVNVSLGLLDFVFHSFDTISSGLELSKSS